MDINYLNIKGEDINLKEEIDYCFSIGVLHHIPDVDRVVKNIFDALKPEGEAVFWFYGFEGNELYVLIFNNLRRLTRIMPDFLLRWLCSLLNVFCSTYIFLIRCLPFFKIAHEGLLIRSVSLTIMGKEKLCNFLINLILLIQNTIEKKKWRILWRRQGLLWLILFLTMLILGLWFVKKTQPVKRSRGVVRTVATIPVRN